MKSNSSQIAILGLSLLGTGGCTGVTHSVVNAADGGTGVRYYQTSPYLLVNSDGRGGIQWRILYLPDRTKKMMAEPYAVAARSDLVLQFHNGALTGTSAAGDSTEVPKAILAAVQAAAATLAGGAMARSGVAPDMVPAPYLYKIVVKSSTVTFIGGPGDDPIVVPPPEGVP